MQSPRIRPGRCRWVDASRWTRGAISCKARATGTLSEAERMSFQITPFYFYLTRAENSSPTQIPVGVAAKLDREANTK